MKIQLTAGMPHDRSLDGITFISINEKGPYFKEMRNSRYLLNLRDLLAGYIYPGKETALKVKIVFHKKTDILLFSKIAEVGPEGVPLKATINELNVMVNDLSRITFEPGEVGLWQIGGGFICITFGRWARTIEIS